MNLRNLDVAGMAEDAEGREKPNDHADDDDNVEDLFDLGIHGNVVVDEPEQDTDDDKSYEKGNHLWLLSELFRLVSIQDTIRCGRLLEWGVYPMRLFVPAGGLTGPSQCALFLSG